jgi:hypothetical protein
MPNGHVELMSGIPVISWENAGGVG